mmetsp:Transcript_86434/g.217625  ORF Transcript_86434/g.217625 Transcript_86434/m.217625 type:complete len:668 (+) Transcript_86434:98-2101(+)
MGCTGSARVAPLGSGTDGGSTQWFPCACGDNPRRHYAHFVEQGGHSSVAQRVGSFYDRARTRRYIERPEERSLSMEDLVDIRGVIERGCSEEAWTADGKDTSRRLGPDEVNLYHVNYHHICPATVPAGVKLSGLTKRRYVYGQTVVQMDKSAQPEIRAAGFVQATTTGSSIKVVVTKGRFVSVEKGIARPVLVDGTDAGEPAQVSYRNAVSYKELVSPVPLKPQFFCSHWWGEPQLHFIKCCEEHAMLRKLSGDKASYWVCAYANRQHDLGAEIATDPADTSFRRAMDIACGVLLILDGAAKPFQRIWCCYELHTTVLQADKLMDIVTFHNGCPHLLSDGELPDENSWQQRRREMKFPIHLLTEGLRCRLEHGQATWKMDRVRILNSMAGRTMQLDDHSILEMLETHRHKYDRANDAMHARFAIAAWPQALKRGLVENFDEAKSGSLNLSRILASHQERKVVKLDFRNFEEMTDAAAKTLAAGLPTGVEDLELILGACPISDTGLRALAMKFGTGIKKLHLYLAACGSIGDEGILALARRLPQEMHTLNLVCSRCTRLTDESIEALAKKLPGGLEDLSLDFSHCTGITGAGLQTLSLHVPASLKRLCLQFKDCRSISTHDTKTFARRLPKGVHAFEGNLRGSGVGRSFSSLAELQAWADDTAPQEPR